MKIGIDLDGVCYGFTEAFCDLIGDDPTQVNKWRFYEDMGITEAGFLRICRNAVRQGKLFAEGYLLPGTARAFEALREMGHTIHIVTDRCSLDPDDSGWIIQATKDWLADEGLEYDTIHFTGAKAQVAEELGLDFFLDDRTENVFAVDYVTKAYLFDRPWNQPDGLALNRVHSWGDFVRIVKDAQVEQDECYLSHPHVGAHVRDTEQIPTYKPLVFGETSNGDPVVIPTLTDSLDKFHVEEVRVTSETGGQKGQKLARIGSLDPQALMEVAKVAGFGEHKYARLNYLNGYDWSLSYDACQRHLHAFWSGENLDPESGLPHLAHAAWHCCAMLAFLIHGLGSDDRYVKPEEDAA